MTTTTRPAPAAPAPVGGASRRASSGTAAVRSRRTARSGGAAVLGTLLLTAPAVGLLGAARPATSTLDVAASFLVVAGLDVVAGRGLYLATRHRAHPAAYAALLSRLGHALLLVVAATLLAGRGAAGLPAFREDWSTALLVLAVHLVVAGVAVWRARLAPRAVSTAVALSGAASLVLAATTAGGSSLLPVVVPVLAGEALLATALLQHSLRPRR